MSKNIVYSVFTDDEVKLYEKARGLRDKLLKPLIEPLVKFVVKHNLSPDLISWFGFAVICPFYFIFASNPWIAFLFIVFNVIIDSIDGSVARFSMKESVKGAVLDTAIDHLSFFVVFYTILVNQLMNGPLALLYMSNYIVLVFLVIIARALKITVFPVLRSKYVFFLMVALLTFFGINYFDYFLVFLAVYMFITNIFLFRNIRWEL